MTLEELEPLRQTATEDARIVRDMLFCNSPQSVQDDLGFKLARIKRAKSELAYENALQKYLDEQQQRDEGSHAHPF